MFEIPVKITYKIEEQLVADLLCTLIEGSDVSSWCGHVSPVSVVPEPGLDEYWYADGKFINENFKIKFLVDDPETGDDGDHSLEKVVGYSEIQRGLELMQMNHPGHFEDMLGEGTWDCITADVFWQLVIYGEVIYG